MSQTQQKSMQIIKWSIDFYCFLMKLYLYVEIFQWYFLCERTIFRLSEIGNCVAMHSSFVFVLIFLPFSFYSLFIFVIVAVILHPSLFFCFTLKNSFHAEIKELSVFLSHYIHTYIYTHTNKHLMYLFH